MERSICVRPKPAMSLRPSVPCLVVEGTENALTFKILPPGAVAFAIQKGCPATMSGRVNANPIGSGDVPNTVALNGNPLRATRTVSMDQFRVRRAKAPDFAAAGREYAKAPEKL